MISIRPSESWTWPEQNRSAGVGTVLNVPVLGWYTAVLKVPAANASGSFPEPATIRTLPFLRTTAWMPRTGDSNGITCQTPAVQAAPALHDVPAAGWVASTMA